MHRKEQHKGSKAAAAAAVATEQQNKAHQQGL
jgi:hypothetical protein